MLKVFIVNPVAGNGKALSLIEHIRQKYNNAIIEVTDGVFSAKDIAEKYSNSNAIIYSVGGDGTLNEIVNGMAEGNSTLRVIPAGSGNDFAKAIYPNLDPIALIDDEELRTSFIDLGMINDRYFINIATVGGVDALIGKKTNESNERKDYAKNVIKSLIEFKAPKVQYCINNVTYDDEIMLFAICNGYYYGNGYHVAPIAILNDGLFDVYVADKINKISSAMLSLKMKKGKHYKHEKDKESAKNKHISFYRTDNLHIFSKENLICNVDGETICGNGFDIKLKKRSIRLSV